MHKLKQYLLMLALAPMVLIGCSSGTNNTQPNQADTNAAYQEFVGAILFVLDGFDSVTTCAELETALNDFFSGTTDCTGGGTTSFTSQVVTCTDSPLAATFNISIILDNCSEDGIVTDGQVNLDITYNSASGTISAVLSGSGLVSNGLTFSFNDLTVELDFNSTPVGVTCGGTADVDGFTCTTASDCSACTF